MRKQEFGTIAVLKHQNSKTKSISKRQNFEEQLAPEIIRVLVSFETMR